MINAEAAFACFAEKKQVGRTKIDQMVDLLPHIDKAVANGYLLSEVLQKASEVIGCTNLARSSLYSLYFRAVKKAGKVSLLPEIADVRPVAIPINPSTKIVTEATGKAQSDDQSVRPQTSVGINYDQKSQESGMEQWRAAQAARVEAIKKLEALGEEAGAWVASTYQDLSVLKEDAAWTEWLDAEPGRRQMVDELVRTAFRGGQNPEVADRPTLSDFMLQKFSGSTDMSLSKRIHKAKVLATRRVA